MKKTSGSICAPLGFRAGAVFCDIKRLGTGKGSEKGRKTDLALILSDVPASAAGMFTQNRMRAAPVELCERHLRRDRARLIVVNSGNANACTGAQGSRDAQRMATLAAEAVRSDAIDPRDVLVCSTGRIGVPLPMQNVERGIRFCAPLLARSAEKGRAAAEAIMTSDTRRKEIAVEFKIANRTVRIGGICKGAGMIHPRLEIGKHATMLAFITTDAAISATALRQALKLAAEQSFNRISVDGDTSTNDSVIILANGLAKNPKLHRIKRSSFQIALNFVCLELAKMMVRDGEGVTRFITLNVRGARRVGEAEKIARSIANSALVKTSWCGGDPNWGRILSAIGTSGVSVDQSRVSLGYRRANKGAILYGFRSGKPTNVLFSKLAAITSQPEFEVHVNLGAGKTATTFYTCDLTENYVTFNKGDITDPDSLGG